MIRDFFDTYALPVHLKEYVQEHAPHRQDAHLIALAQAQLVLPLVHPMKYRECL